MRLLDIAPVLYGTYRYTYTPGRSRPKNITAEKTQCVYRLLIPTAGRLLAEADGTPISVTVGEALLLPPAARYRFTDSEVGFSLINISFALLPVARPRRIGCVAIADFRPEDAIPTETVEDAAELNTACVLRGDVAGYLPRLMEGGGRAGGLHARAALLSLLASLLEGGRAAPPAATGEILTYIHTHPDGDLSPDALARRFSYHKNHINRLVRAATGKPLSALVRAVRVAHAKTLLAEGGHSPTALAHALGYYDYSHLRRAFLQETGMTPAAYAARHGQ